MFRKNLIEILVERAYSVEELAELHEEKPRDVETDLHHLLLSLRHQPYEVVIVPARCRRCGFDRFRTDRLRKPSRCPQCKANFLDAPRIRLRRTS